MAAKKKTLSNELSGPDVVYLDHVTESLRSKYTMFAIVKGLMQRGTPAKLKDIAILEKELKALKIELIDKLNNLKK